MGWVKGFGSKSGREICSVDVFVALLGCGWGRLFVCLFDYLFMEGLESGIQWNVQVQNVGLRLRMRKSHSRDGLYRATGLGVWPLRINALFNCSPVSKGKTSFSNDNGYSCLRPDDGRTNVMAVSGCTCRTISWVLHGSQAQVAQGE